MSRTFIHTALAGTLCIGLGTLAAHAQTALPGGSVGSALSVGGSVPGVANGAIGTASAALSPAPDLGLPAASGTPGPGGTRLAPGPAGPTMPGERTGPGGVRLAPGPAGLLSGTALDSAGTASSGRPRRAGLLSLTDCLARADSAGFGPLPRIMADEPGRAGKSIGADAGRFESDTLSGATGRGADRTRDATTGTSTTMPLAARPGC